MARRMIRHRPIVSPTSWPRGPPTARCTGGMRSRTKPRLTSDLSGPTPGYSSKRVARPETNPSSRLFGLVLWLGVVIDRLGHCINQAADMAFRRLNPACLQQCGGGARIKPNHHNCRVTPNEDTCGVYPDRWQCRVVHRWQFARFDSDRTPKQTALTVRRGRSWPCRCGIPRRPLKIP